MNKEETKYVIDQLRKDKMVYALEACAINTMCLLAIFLSGLVPAVAQFGLIVPIGISLIGIVYTLYTVIGNIRRFLKIRKLEKKLKLEITML